MHGNKKVHTNISFEELRLVHPALPTAVHELSDVCDRAGTELLERVTATVAHLVGSSINLNEYDETEYFYPNITNITAVKSTSVEGYFAIKCIAYRASTLGLGGIYLPHVKSGDEEMVSAKVLDAIWPGASKHVLTMESFGYVDEDIVSTLFAGVPTSGSDIDIPSIIFE